jgi:hypothetical protein
MPEYQYPQLPSTSIRLLRLLPGGKSPNILRGELFEYPIQGLDTTYHPYEALSYVWGSEEKPDAIIVNDKTLPITENLHRALLQLQPHDYHRVIWIDAICIDQENEHEKEHQIPLMAEIYAKACRVVVWLGEAKEAGDDALEYLRLTAERSEKLSNAVEFEANVLQLLRRPWFGRIWVRI